jgi:hypothetical protein
MEAELGFERVFAGFRDSGWDEYLPLPRFCGIISSLPTLPHHGF